jgi:hypothetical protein
MGKITVVAKAGCVCPRERPGETFINDKEPAIVKNTPFYTRLIRDGSLRIWQQAKAPVKKTEKAVKVDKTEKTDKPDKPTGGNK